MTLNCLPAGMRFQSGSFCAPAAIADPASVQSTVAYVKIGEPILRRVVIHALEYCSKEQKTKNHHIGLRCAAA
jgi:hypothetical protein